MNRVLCGDIGGTNARFCIVDLEKGFSLEAYRGEHTQNYDNFPDLVNTYLSSLDYTPKQACFAVAGPVRGQKVTMTNARMTISARDTEDKTPLEKVLIINDFEAIGYSINILHDSEVKILNAGSPEKNATIAVVGAGTGLGKNILVYDKKSGAYLPHPSEGGHSDLPFYPEEIEIAQFIKKAHRIENAMEYEDILSGKGLERLYDMLQNTKFPERPPKREARDISNNRLDCPCCRETFDLFVRFYARCAKNFALDTLALGGIYLAGGIAADNADRFGEAFLAEFTRHRSDTFTEILEKIPVRLITESKISLKGAAFALKLMQHHRFPE